MIFMVFLYGIVIGSFLNVCIYRIPAEKSIVRPASSCGSCGTTLKWKDLVPIFSYMFLGGECRYCGEKVSKRYPLIELLTGLLTVAVYMKYGMTYTFLKYVILTIILIVIGFIDFDTTDVYAITTIPSIIIGIVFILLENIGISNTITEYIKNVATGSLGGILGILIIGAICYFTGGMGEGDIEIAALIGFFLGWRLTIFMLLLSFIVGGVIGGFLILSKRKTKEDEVAFGPSLAIAAYITIILGSNFIMEYIIKF